jgi:hypothetical protein
MRLIILLIFACLITTALSAQDPLVQTWNFAITLDATNSGTGLIAYNGAGETHQLLEGLVTYNSGGYRLDSQIVLAILSLDGSEGLYKLTPQSAELLRYTSDEAITVDGKLLVDYSPPYALLTDTRVSATGQQALLVNLEDKTYTPLPDLVSSITRLNCCRFSDDGTSLRYISAEADDGQSFALREFDTAAGESQVFASLDLAGFATPTRDGEIWLARFVDRERQTVAFKLIHADGSSKTLVEEPQSVATVYQLFGDYLVSMSLRCEDICDIRVKPIDQPDAAQIFHMQLDEPSIIQWFYRTSGGNFVILMDETYWLLEDEDTIETLGYFDFRHLAQSPAELVSPDGRWLLMMDGDGENVTGYSVWDGETKTHSLSVETPENWTFVSILYGEDSYLLRDLSSKDAKTRLFRYEAGTILELPDTDIGMYSDFLTSDSLIYIQRDASEDRTPGIYRYDISTETFTFLVENAQPLFFRDVSTIDARQ